MKTSQSMARRCFGCLIGPSWLLLWLLFLSHQVTVSSVLASSDTCTSEDIENGTCQSNGKDTASTTKKGRKSKQSPPPSNEEEDDSSSSSSSVWKIPANVLERSQDAAQQAQKGYGTRIVSNLIDDPRILQQLTDHREWFACYENTRGHQTHWYDKNDPPSTIWEYLAIQMWRDQPILQTLVEEEDFAGFEIWCNILTPQGPLPWHVDKDQVLYEQSRGKQLQLPLYGSVWYGYPHEFTGGYLELVKYDTNTWPEGMEEPDPDDIERIEAEYNRLVVFNASKFHRVSPIHSGARITLAVNVWKEKPGGRRY
jgi:hypothetical protein